MNEDELGNLVVEIFKGYSVYTSSFGAVYVKHFDQLETKEIFAKRSVYHKEGVSKGLRTEEEALQSLIEEGMWSSKKEKNISEKKRFLDNLKKSLSKIQIPSQREQHKSLIKKEQDELLKISEDRNSLIGLTAEKYADKKVNKNFFENLVYYDSEFKKSVYESLEYQDIEKEVELTSIQNNFFKKLTDDNISKAALCSYYSPYLSYAEDVIGMFGKPLVQLTSFQLKLLTYSRSFLNIFKNCQKDIPDYVSKDPQLLMEFYEASKNTQKRTKAAEGDGGTTYFGATEDDINVMKNDDETAVSLSKELQKRGGKLDMEQMMKMHGV